MFFAILHEPGMDVHAASGLARGDLGCKGDGNAIFIGKRADDPFCDQELVGSIFDVDGEKFNLVLLKGKTGFGEISDLRMSVFDGTPATGDGLAWLPCAASPICRRARIHGSRAGRRLRRAGLFH